MEWGNDKADKLGVESFVESTEDGKPLYDGYGFATMNDFNLEPTKSNPGPEWQKTAKTLLPMHGYFMWRPILGKYEEGKTVIPWEEKTNQPFSIEERRNL